VLKLSFEQVLKNCIEGKSGSSSKTNATASDVSEPIIFAIKSYREIEKRLSFAGLVDEKKL